MPIFTQSLQKIDENNPQDAVKKLYNHIKYIQEQLEYTLLNLDSQNINEIDTDKTVITDSTGDTNIGSSIYLAGTKGEFVKIGKSASGFAFTVTGANRKQMIYMDRLGRLIITENVNLTVDGGEW